MLLVINIVFRSILIVYDVIVTVTEYAIHNKYTSMIYATPYSREFTELDNIDELEVSMDDSILIVEQPGTVLLLVSISISKLSC